jgi:GntR family transcriptional repressor for pyruvate dehydrogenase complex
MDDNRALITSVDPVRPAYEQVAEQLRAMILSGSLPPGSRLPLESELGRRFGVSRPTVREALRSLGAQRLIRTTKGPGGGNFVTPPTVRTVSELVESSLSLIARAENVSLEEFLEVREVLEIRAAKLAAERRTPEHLERLRATIPDEPLRLATENQFAHNRDFHAEMLTAAGNTLLYLAAQPIFLVLQTKLDRSTLGPRVHRAINEQHRELTRAITDGNPDEAADLMGEHLAYLRPAYERAWVK